MNTLRGMKLMIGKKPLWKRRRSDKLPLGPITYPSYQMLSLPMSRSARVEGIEHDHFILANVEFVRGRGVPVIGRKARPVAQAADIAKNQHADQLEEERLKMHGQAIDLIFGMWKDREGGPPDGVEYQEDMRATW